jgi:type II secretory pathway predicted ATPase ExeA
MYLDYFGLRSAPFRLAPDPEFLYLSPKHKLGLSLLRYGLTEAGGGLTVITGHVGAGKTTLLRQILRELDGATMTVGLLDNTLNFDEHLIRWVASAFNLPYEGRESIAVFREFQQFVIREYAQGRQTLLIIDEAQNLSDKALEEIRLLTNINAEQDQLLKIVLIGQPELLQQLSSPRLSQIAQRVSVEYHLEPLTRDETAQYIRHRMQVAGGSGDIFSGDTIDAIHSLSGGVPRLINTLCDQALVYAYAMEEPLISPAAVREVSHGRRIAVGQGHAPAVIRES